ncbi:hypothetical protein [Sphingobium aquiterrae]|uniref:hypothetical protein n=1 Tax=Sphingobium aquiterrae TaxID=2038656 RepID=UPI0030188694
MGRDFGMATGAAPLIMLAMLAMLGGASPAALAQNREADAYTRYELLAPGTHSFRIVYEITAITPGATAYYNPIRPGSTATEESVIDRATGKPLKFGVVDGPAARAGGVRGAAPDSQYIEVRLARPVPADGGEGRVLIDKTYEDAKSYYSDGDMIVFDRLLGNKRNAVVLPKGYELVSVNTPSQVLQEPDGRIRIAFWNDSAAPSPLIVKARPVPGFGAGGPSAMVKEFDERAHQDRKIVYDLNAPETHSFSLTHDYTETRPGVSTYVNLVRAGSTVSDPSARNIDTGAALPGELLRGEAIRKAAPRMSGIMPDSMAVLFHFPPVKPGESMRLRIAETYTDPARYLLQNGELLWHRAFGRPANAVVLPAGWVLTNSSVPATVKMTADGRVRLDFINPRTDEIDTIITARRRPNP